MSDLTPSLQKALAIWDGLPESERNYKRAAAEYGVTAGRMADYIRRALAATGREAELPRKGNGNTQAPTAQPQSPRAALEQLRDQLKARIESTRVGEFDADAFRKAEEERRSDAVKVAQARLKRWRDDADQEATKAVEKAQSEHKAKAERISKDVEQMQAALEQYEATLKLLPTA